MILDQDKRKSFTPVTVTLETEAEFAEFLKAFYLGGMDEAAARAILAEGSSISIPTGVRAK